MWAGVGRVAAVSLALCLPADDHLGWTFNFKSLVMAARGGNLTQNLTPSLTHDYKDNLLTVWICFFV